MASEPSSSILQEGYAYFLGDGVDKNLEKAFALFSEASRKGDKDAMYAVAICHVRGFGVEKDRKKGESLLVELARDGNVCAQYSASRASILPATEKMEMLRTAAENGHAYAQHSLDCLNAVARLGGYLARRGDPPPGNMVLWRGFKRLIDIHLGFTLRDGGAQGVGDNDGDVGYPESQTETKVVGN